MADLGQVAVRVADVGAGDVIVHQVQQHIDLHLDEQLRIADLAAAFGLSERTLSRRFAAATWASQRPRRNVHLSGLKRSHTPLPARGQSALSSFEGEPEQVPP